MDSITRTSTGQEFDFHDKILLKENSKMVELSRFRLYLKFIFKSKRISHRHKQTIFMSLTICTEQKNFPLNEKEECLFKKYIMFLK